MAVHTSPTTLEARWATLQERYGSTHDSLRAYRASLDARYSHHNYARRGEQVRLAKLQAAADKAWDNVWTFVQKHSPRAVELSSGTPVWQIGRQLTFADLMRTSVRSGVGYFS